MIESADKNKDLVELPDYDLQILEEDLKGQIVRTDRVLHISRDNLLALPAGDLRRAPDRS